MMIIPAIDIQGGRCVRLAQGQRGTETVYSEDPVEMGRRWMKQGAELLHVVDLDGAFAGEPKNRELISGLIQKVRIPIQVGGGINSIDNIEFYINSGAKSVILGTKAALDPNFVKKSCAVFPGKVLVSIDAKKGQVVARGWAQATGRTAIELAREMAELGIPAVIYTDVERDGMLAGPNLEAIETLAQAVKLPVIASGGVSRLSDVQALLALEPKGVVGVIIGKALYAGMLNLPNVLALTRRAG